MFSAGPTSVEEVTAAENEEEEFSTSQQRSRRGSGGDGFDKVKGASPCSSDTRPSPISRRATALPLEDDVQRRQPHRGKGLRCSTSTSNIPDAGPDRRSRDHRPAAERRESDTAAAALTVQPPRRRNRGSPEREDGGVDVYADGRDNPARPLDLNDGIRGGVCGMGDRGAGLALRGRGAWDTNGSCSKGTRRRGSVRQQQTEGQRAAAERLRAWQERRRRVEGVHGGGGGGGREDAGASSREVRAVRNYNVREDLVDAGVR